MGTETIPDNAYRKLAEEKREGEGFGGVIDRLLEGRPLSDFWGAWSEETAEHTREAVREGRERSDGTLVTRDANFDRIAGLDLRTY